MASTCKYHPRVSAAFTCFDCQAPVCEDCIRTRDDGTLVCASCATGMIALADEPVGYSDQPATPCANHPQVPAVTTCNNCQARICYTCDFAFDGMHLCPRCAVADTEAITPQRKKMGVMGLVVGAIDVPASAISFAIILSVEHMGEDMRIAANLISSVVLVACLGAAVTGFLLGIYAIERKAPNPFYLWIGPALNGLISAFWILLLVVGLFAMA